MRSVLARLLIVVETIDRNLLTVPDVDEYDPPSTRLRLKASHAGMR